jgi:hypothetical protein
MQYALRLAAAPTLLEWEMSHETSSVSSFAAASSWIGRKTCKLRFSVMGMLACPLGREPIGISEQIRN